MNRFPLAPAALVAAALLALAGCVDAEKATAPLIFGQGHTIGLSVTPSATGAGGEVVFGFRDANIAVVPTLVPGRAPTARPDGAETYDHKLVSIGASPAEEVDAYSTFGQFDFSSEGAKIGLGKFFATGVAAQHLARGFGCGAAGENGENCFAPARSPASPTE